VPSDLLVLEGVQSIQIKNIYFGSLVVCRFNTKNIHIMYYLYCRHRYGIIDKDFVLRGG
jgi:hypothetical protein